MERVLPPFEERHAFKYDWLVNTYSSNAVRRVCATTTDQNRRMFFIPYTQDAERLFSMCVVLRTANESPALTARIRDEVRSAARGLPVTKIDTLAGQFDQSLFAERLTAALSAAFAVVAAALACMGVYGVIAFSVARRRSEIGVLMALGASRAELVAMVLLQSALLAAAGIAAGIPLALVVMRFSSAILFGVRIERSARPRRRGRVDAGHHRTRRIASRA